MSVEVLAPGLSTSVQDAGRTGLRRLGVGMAGALDPHSHALANLLVGNPADAPVLEITLTGPRLRFGRAACVAVCGADVEVTIDGRALPGWRPAWVPAGATLHLGACRRGARAYLAVDGGFAPVPVLGSASTDLRGGFGGVEGRALAAGDVLPLGEPRAVAVENTKIAPWWLDPAPDLDFSAPAVLRVLPGSDATAPADALPARAWRVAPASDRQGLRLSGPALALADARERVSEPVAPGTVQLPPDGQPIVLLADAQTHGGYPRIGHAIAADLPRLAQLRPGETVRFAECTPAQALQARRAQAQRLARATLAIASRAASGRRRA